MVASAGYPNIVTAAGFQKVTQPESSIMMMASLVVSAFTRSRIRSTRSTPGTFRSAATNAAMTESGLSLAAVSAPRSTNRKGVSQMKRVESFSAAAVRASAAHAVSRAARTNPAPALGSFDLTPGYGATP